MAWVTLLVLYNGVRRSIFRGVLPHEGDSGFMGLFVNGGRF
jgi:hypothetical protein